MKLTQGAGGMLYRNQRGSSRLVFSISRIRIDSTARPYAVASAHGSGERPTTGISRPIIAQLGVIDAPIGADTVATARLTSAGAVEPGQNHMPVGVYFQEFKGKR